MARLIRERCGPPVVCQLSGEDIFLEKLTPPHYEQARALLRERAGDIDAFVALNNFHADFMADYLAVNRSRIHVIPHGLNLVGHGTRREKSPNEPRIIGFLARICSDKGLHLLIEACEQLAKRTGVPRFVVRWAGYEGEADREYHWKILSRVIPGGDLAHWKYMGELDRNKKITFLQSLDVFSTPTVYRESKGLPALEAMANAVPVVLPDHGSFTEMIADTGGGLLHCPLDPADLADKIAELLLDPQRATQLGTNGQRAVHDRYNAPAMARQTVELYKDIIKAS
jgi:glycosyltransferase involved in cell wall biosynthesis